MDIFWIRHLKAKLKIIEVVMWDMFIFSAPTIYGL